jgi:Holliday junction resolvase
MRYRRGASAERELMKALEERGFAVVRSAGSKKVDIVAGNGRTYLCIEVKSTHSDKIYLTEEDLNKLTEFSRRFGGKAFLAVKFVNREWKFFEPEKLTKSGKSYRITYPDGGMTLDEALGIQKSILEVLKGEKN